MKFFFGGEKCRKIFRNDPKKNVAAHIDVGYGFGLRKKLRIKTWKRSMTKKKGRQKFWENKWTFFGEKCRKIFRNDPKKMLPPILMWATDLGYGKNCVLKPGKGRDTKKKVVRNFGRIDEHFLGENAKRFSETPVKSRKNMSEKICSPTLKFWIRQWSGA